MNVDLSVPGYKLLRPLSDRPNSKLFLARAAERRLLALKLEFPEPDRKTQPILDRYAFLEKITAHEGFTPILRFGSLPSGWIWHAMPLADNLPGLASIASPKGLIEYTPLTLAAWTIENRRAPARQVAEWGKRICDALAVLHKAGLVHRDIKPGNLIFIAGQLCLADYGLVGEPGSEHDFSGTEGFIPLEGTSSAAADLFALGKTLYQAWSGKDRLEFPSLPLSATEGSDWKKHGFELNKLLLRACHAQPSRRFQSAEDLSHALGDVQSGEKQRPTRRQWLCRAGSLAAGTSACAFIFARRSRPITKAVWRRVGPNFNLEAWQGHFGTVDWTKSRLYSVCRDFATFTFYSVDLNTFEVSTKALDPLPKDSVFSILHPASGNLWAVEDGFGEVFEINVQSGAVKSLSGGPPRRLSLAAYLYWNPLTGRLGTFGGYGNMRVHNSRHEFDLASGKWIEIKQDGPLPWPRESGRPFFHGEDPTRLFLAGGIGSPSGVQGKAVPGLRGFNSQFHLLDDIWELDLRTNRWRELLANGRFPIPPQEPGARAALYHPGLKAIVLLSSPTLGGTEDVYVRSWLFRPDVDHAPLEIPAEGDISRIGQPWAYMLDPRNQDVIFLAPDGIFRISLV